MYDVADCTLPFMELIIKGWSLISLALQCVKVKREYYSVKHYLVYKNLLSVRGGKHKVDRGVHIITKSRKFLKKVRLNVE